MAQPQHQIHTPAAFSPPPHSPSPAATQGAFPLPPNKRARLSPGPPSQPASPYATSPYAVSPGAVATPSTAATSPSYSGIQLPATAASTTHPTTPGYSTPYTNGHTTTTISLPDVRPSPTPLVTTPSVPPLPNPSFTNATLAPFPTPTPTPGTMGPPSRPTKEYEYDVTDSLAGTGIDIRAEDQYMTEMFSTQLDTQNAEARTGFPHLPPGSKATMYGAGPANQPAQATTLSQNQLAAQAAEKAWNESATRLAQSRSHEIKDPFLQVSILHRRFDKIAREHGIALNVDMKNTGQVMGRMRLPTDFPAPTVKVSTKIGPDSAVIQTTGSWIPHDAYLVDQLALLSIATKHRFREMVEDADRVARNRQSTSHGEIPEDWAEAAAPLSSTEAANGTGLESAVSPRTNPLKRKDVFY
jgi:hypothetical protein